MHILMIAQEPALDRDKVVTGNAIRANQLATCLTDAGHRITHVWQNGGALENTFSNRDELRSLLAQHNADVHLVTYWELLDLMPFESPVPLVLDFVAPRPLEQLYSDPSRVTHDLHRLHVNLGKVDLLLVGSRGQRELMLMSMLAAGFDLREYDPVCIVPLAGDFIGPPRSEPTEHSLTLVAGGVNWPWRNASPYWEAIESMDEFNRGELKLVRFGGTYSLHADQVTDGTVNHEKAAERPLQAYSAYSDFLTSQAHIGLELSAENIERRYSHSFRSLEFLTHGLPVICNGYLPMAADIREHDAGWVIDQPEQLPPLLREILAQPEAWWHKALNAQRYAYERLKPALAGKPLLDWLKHPCKAPALGRSRLEAPALLSPPATERARRMAIMTTNQLRRRLFLLQKKLFGGRKADGIVFVTRGDLFPADHGAAVKIIETARGLSKLGRPVALVTDDRRHWWSFDKGEITQHRIPFWLRLLTWPSAWTKLKHYSLDIPQSNAFLYLPLTDGSFFWRTLYAGRKVGAAIIQAEFPAYVRPSVPAGHVLDARVVLVEHNVEYLRIRTQVPELTGAQFERYKSIEIDMANKADAVICVSDNDRQQLAVDGVDTGRLYTIPHGVDLEQFEQPAYHEVRARFGIPAGAPILVYHGTFSYPPNLQALQVFANELLPRLEKLGLICHVLAVGREPPASSPHPRIHLTGSVHSVAPWLKAADMAVVPLLDGGGTRMKIIDCFAAGIPVISTSKGIEGIPARHDVHALIIDDWDQMASSIQDLLGNPALSERLVRASSEMAAGLDWKSIAAEYIKVFDSL